MNELNEKFDQARDPLGLRRLEWQEPARDGWPEIRAELEQGRRSRSRLGWLAVAASLVLAVSVSLRVSQEPVEQAGTQEQPAFVQTASDAQPDNVEEQNLDALIALSQNLEKQLRGMRSGTGSMPASSAVYIAELQDLVAQVDQELSYAPDSVNLWGQRVNLLLDLAQIYQHQWELDYGKMASL